MKKKIIVFTDEQAKELEKYPNQSETVRNAFEVYNGHITPEVIKGLQEGYKRIHQRLIGIENAVGMIAEAGSVQIDKHNTWGA
jgi:hypothetical protein